MISTSLAQMGAGQTGIIHDIQGGHGMRTKLEAMGIRPGVRITKVSGQIMRGPIIVRAGKTQVAIGFGMARKVFVSIE